MIITSFNTIAALEDPLFSVPKSSTSCCDVDSVLILVQTTPMLLNAAIVPKPLGIASVTIAMSRVSNQGEIGHIEGANVLWKKEKTIMEQAAFMTRRSLLYE